MCGLDAQLWFDRLIKCVSLMVAWSIVGSALYKTWTRGSQTYCFLQLVIKFSVHVRKTAIVCKIKFGDVVANEMTKFDGSSHQQHTIQIWD